MTAIYVTAKTDDMGIIFEQIFTPGVQYTVTDDDSNDDGTRTARAEWDGEFEQAISFRAGSHPAVIGHQVLVYSSYSYYAINDNLEDIHGQVVAANVDEAFILAKEKTEASGCYLMWID